MVVGMARSGTSMLAAVFARLGYFVAEDPDNQLQAPTRANPTGWWEAEPLIERNLEVLRAAGFQHHNTWMFEAITPEQAARVDGLSPLPGHPEFVERYQERAPWVWKDCRLCYTLRYWWPLVDADTTRVLLIKRNPEATVASFVRLGWCEAADEARADLRRRIHDHIRQAESTVEKLGIPHLTLSYDAFRDEGPHIARQLSDFLEVPLSAPDLLFRERFDHSSVRGRVTVLLERLVTSVPKPIRRTLKAIIPTSLLRKLLPGMGF
jgi:hypothetical protein